MSIVSRLRLLLVPLAVFLALAGVAGVAAAPPTPASGTFTVTAGTFSNPRVAGGNTIYDSSGTLAWTGAFSGTGTTHGTLIFHPDGTVNSHEVEVFVGTVAGIPGTVTFVLEGRARPTTGDVLAFEETDVVVGATGALAGLHGVLRLVGTVPAGVPGPLGTYRGQFQSGRP